jgi:hypothetical protein
MIIVLLFSHDGVGRKKLIDGEGEVGKKGEELSEQFSKLTG